MDWSAAAAPTHSTSNGTVALNLGAAVSFFVLVVVAIAFDWLALKGVLVVGFLSVALAYLVLPLVRVIRRISARQLGGWRPSRILAVLIVYASVAIIVAPIWAIWGQKVVSQVPDVAREVPRQVSRFVSQVRASERWYERFAFERVVKIMMATAESLVNAGQEVGGNKKRAPAFVLADVNPFVVVCVIEFTDCGTEDDMSKCHRAGVDAIQKPIRKPAVELQGVPDPSATTT